MDLSILKSLGLTNDQVKTYQTLIESGAQSPARFAEATGESRTNAYMSLKKLEALGLATHEEVNKKLVYKAVSPAKIELLLHAREQELKTAREELHVNLPALLTTFYRAATMPGIAFYEGTEGLKTVYEDHIATGADVYFVRTPEDIDESFFGDYLYDYMERRAAAGITSYGLAPHYPSAVAWAKKNDKHLKRQMTWYDPAQYSAPVEISIYGNKVAFISFGDEIVSCILESPQIATAMRELFIMGQGGAKPKGRLRF